MSDNTKYVFKIKVIDFDKQEMGMFDADCSGEIDTDDPTQFLEVLNKTLCNIVLKGLTPVYLVSAVGTNGFNYESGAEIAGLWDDDKEDIIE